MGLCFVPQVGLKDDYFHLFSITQPVSTSLERYCCLSVPPLVYTLAFFSFLFFIIFVERACIALEF